MNGLSTIHRINSEAAAPYDVDTTEQNNKDKEIVEQALEILLRRMRVPGAALTSPDAVTQYLQLTISEREYELFYCVYLDTKHRVIDLISEFRGTIDGCTIHAREVVVGALYRNAAAVIFAHNHPSGNAEPSQQDVLITGRLKSALALIDVRVLDHFIITPSETVSLQQRGLL